MVEYDLLLNIFYENLNIFKCKCGGELDFIKLVDNSYDVVGGLFRCKECNKFILNKISFGD